MSLLSRSVQPLAVLAAIGGLVVAMPMTAAAATPAGQHSSAFAVQQVNLVSDQAGKAALTDPDLVNPWGLALSPTSPLWVANNGTSTSTLYTNAADTATAAKVAAIRVTFPKAGALPTGQVFNGGTGFVEDATKPTSSARFIFSTITGSIAAWSPVVDPLQGDLRVEATLPGAAYTGLAIATATAGDELFAANFAQNRIDVFDTNFKQVKKPFFAFRDFFVPQSFHTYNVQALGGKIFVTFAKADPKTGREVFGKGLGVVDEFTADGQFVSRVATGQSLNAPWGVAIAPSSFGPLAGSLLIGNFGDGRINIVRPDSDGDFHHFIVGQVKDTKGAPLTIPGLWALTQATAATGGADALWFSAGPGLGAHGLLGVLRKG
jgi:uncharacterized protein (TIGR03118 family)